MVQIRNASGLIWLDITADKCVCLSRNSPAPILLEEAPYMTFKSKDKTIMMISRGASPSPSIPVENRPLR